MEVTLWHHKGADNKPKPYVTTPCILSQDALQLGPSPTGHYVCLPVAQASSSSRSVDTEREISRPWPRRTHFTIGTKVGLDMSLAVSLLLDSCLDSPTNPLALLVQCSLLYPLSSFPNAVDRSLNFVYAFLLYII
jgi:hypothetical protein